MNYQKWYVLNFVDVWTNQLDSFDIKIKSNRAKTDILEYYAK